MKPQDKASRRLAGALGRQVLVSHQVAGPAEPEKLARMRHSTRAALQIRATIPLLRKLPSSSCLIFHHKTARTLVDRSASRLPLSTAYELRPGATACVSPLISVRGSLS